jgi:hypothetical protein
LQVYGFIKAGKKSEELMSKKLALLVTVIFIFGVAHANAQQAAIRVHAGGGNYTDSQGHLWSADYGYNTGNPSSCAPNATVTGTSDPQLYKSARWDGADSKEMQYSFAAANGTYTVNLYFAETCSEVKPGNRIFDVQLQGATVFSGIDIAGSVGLAHALVKTANISVTQGQVTVRLVHHGNNNPIVTAIEIVPGTTALTAPAISSQPGSTTVTAGQTATFSVAATGSAPLAYQWRRGTSAITGASASSYTTGATTSTDNGAVFSVVVSNSKGNVTSNNATLTVSTAATGPTISSSPSNQTVASGQTATFSVTASGTAPMTYQWQKNGAAIGGATSSSYTTPAASSADSGAQFRATVSNAVGTATSNNATLTVTAAAAGVDVTTYHNDNARTGQNVKENVLTTANVNSSAFGLKKIVTLDGKVDAQPLFLSGVAVAGQGTHDVVYAVTEHDSVYALDGATGAVLWHASTLSNGETTSDARGCDQVTPEIGITATPVIDRTRGANGAIYVVAMSKKNGTYYQRLYAFDITSGAPLFGGPHTITASYPGSGSNSQNGMITFDPAQYKERTGLLLLGGKIYTTWASHCDIQDYSGWIMSFDANTLAATNVLNLTPNGSDGAVWMSGAGPAADSSGNIYLLDGNGTFDTSLNSSGFPSKGNFGNCFCKISTANGLQVADYFAVSNTISESNADTDLGSGGAMVLPDLVDSNGTTLHLAVGAGKDGNIYVVNRDNMGKYSANANHVEQELVGLLNGGAWSMPAYFNNTVYYGASTNYLRAFTINYGKLSGSATSQAPIPLPYPGATPSISANGSSNGIVWTVINNNPAELHAYDASNLAKELYNSNQAGNSRDHFGNGNKFMTPTIAQGRVYVGTPTGIAIFGTL